MKTLFVIVGVISLAMLAATNAAASDWDKAVTVTFSAPVEVPGRVLPAGTYIFKLLDSPSDRNIVQIFNKDQTQFIATILAIPDYRLHATDKPVITFEERAKGTPEAVQAWFYPGDNYGNEFVYPKAKAVEIAKRTNTPVLSLPTDVATNLSKPVKAPTEAPAVALKKAPVKAVKPTGEEFEIAELVLPNPAAAPAQQKAKQLPKTSSSLPLVGLAGLFCLGGWVALQRMKRAL